MKIDLVAIESFSESESRLLEDVESSSNLSSKTMILPFRSGFTAVRSTHKIRI